MKYDFPSLDDLDMNDMSMLLDKAYTDLEKVFQKANDDVVFSKRLSAILDDLAELANDFDESCFPQYFKFDKKSLQH